LLDLDQRRRFFRPVYGVVLLIVLSGCVPGQGTAEKLAAALDQGSSATASTRLALQLLGTGRATEAFTSVTAEDMFREVTDALNTANAVTPGPGQERVNQNTAVDLLSTAVSTVRTARQVLADDNMPAARAASEELEASTRELTAFSGHLKASK
jgi:hypothetical protein